MLGEPRNTPTGFDWLPIFVLITGISGLVTESVGTTVGVVLIVVGAGGTVFMRRVFPDTSGRAADTG